MNYLGNAFSLQMIDLSKEATINVQPISSIEGDFESVVGHQDTAVVLSNLLGKEVAFARKSIKLLPGDVLIVAQITGGRLPEGSTTLPEGFAFTFVKVTVEE